MQKWFNTAGPCKPDIHYMLSATERLPEIEQLIAQENYFVLHAPRQVGKTTAMITLAQELTASGAYTSVMVSAEVGATFPDEPEKAEEIILAAWRDAADFWLPDELNPPTYDLNQSPQRIGNFLKVWSEASPRPLVIFIDEIDSLQNQTLMTVLRQLRDGFPRRPQGFPQSVALVGMRDVRDYKYASGGSDRLNTSSPFNIKVRSFTLSNFTLEDVRNLYQQHTDATGQVFTPEAVDLAFHLTQGQPWLVNAIAKEIVEYITKDPSIPITAELVNQAKEVLIKRQDTHLDSLAERLREDRVRAVIQPILAGQELPDVPQDDIRYVLDLGLCTNQDGLTIANPIYQEVIPRVLAYVTTASIGYVQPIWLSEQGEFLPNRLLEAFLLFWRQHGEPLFGSTPYPEIAPHLVLMAFLHRVINGGGTLEREYAIGSGKMDICLRYGKVTLGMELKVWRDRRSNPLKEGLSQLDKYLSGLSLDTGWLVIFDRRSGLPPLSDRTTTENVISPAGREIIVIRG
ncbi:MULTISPECIES: ATP-binding protein [Pseudanabaena]|uniref:ATP-binding protein n=1 Tax=Pseudanabaena TaxID=1152 RepID=UPI00247A31AD|nr:MULTISPECIES: ATP-binding protein [Pseudanabaena]MEA5490178.1 ATP-binding protein [Pseudanabaena sp. CCNP1317]WGS75127.1 ATP-binding protein [Pseudanabaena galeata CCNP1313]